MQFKTSRNTKICRIFKLIFFLFLAFMGLGVMGATVRYGKIRLEPKTPDPGAPQIIVDQIEGVATNAIPPLTMVSNRIYLTNQFLLSLTSNYLQNLTVKTITFSNGIDPIATLTHTNEKIVVNGELEAPHIILDTVNTLLGGVPILMNAPFQFVGGNVEIWEPFSIYASAANLTNGSPALATNHTVSPDGYALVKTGNRLKLEQRTSPEQVTNIAESLIITSSLPNIVYVSASRGMANGERNNPLKPFISLSLANGAAQPGDTIMVLDGTFVETLYTKTGVNYWFNRGTRIYRADGNPQIHVEHSGKVGIFGGCTITNGATFGYNILMNAGDLDIECEEVSGYSDALIGGSGTSCYLSIKANVITNYVVSDGALPYKHVVLSGKKIGFEENYGENGIVFYNSEISNYYAAFSTNHLINCTLLNPNFDGYNNFNFCENVKVIGPNPYVQNKVAGTLLIFSSQ